MKASPCSFGQKEGRGGEGVKKRKKTKEKSRKKMRKEQQQSKMVIEI